VGGANELHVRKSPPQIRDDPLLPARVEMQLNLVDQYDSRTLQSSGPNLRIRVHHPDRDVHDHGDGCFESIAQKRDVVCVAIRLAIQQKAKRAYQIKHSKLSTA
jgi:hypothetical protein